MARWIRRCHSSERLAIKQRPVLCLQLTARYRLNVPVPNELWGAAQLAVKLSQNFWSVGTRPVLAKALAASAAELPAEPSPPRAIAEALEFKATLSAAEEVLCFLFAAAVCAALYLSTAPRAFSLSYALAMAAICAGALASARGWLVERQYRAVQRSERELAGPGALFAMVGRAEVHYTRQPPAPSLPPRPAAGGGAVAAHCLHGFGASCFSWTFVQRQLAAALGGVVTAHDMPGFGLSQRPTSPRYYTLGFNGVASRAILDAEMEAWRVQADGQPGDAKRVLIGHSMGGAAAAEAVIQNPGGIAALVLVAPAIVALWTGPPEGAHGDPVATGVALVEEMVSAQDLPDALSSSDSQSSEESVGPAAGAAAELGDERAPPFPPALSAAELGGPRKRRRRRRGSWRHNRPFRVAAAVAHAVVAEAVRLLLVALSPLLVLLLRRLVRSRPFWERGLASAWANKTRVTRGYVDGYRLPQLVRGWEAGMLRFLGARFSEKAGLWAAVAHAAQGDGHLSQTERLAAACKAGGVRVLIVHGVEDALVPVANSRRLARFLPGAQLVEFERCGHMPHEECPERFVEVVASFAKAL